MTTAPSNPSTTVVLHGIPDDGKVGVFSDPRAGVLRFVTPGTASFLQQLRGRLSGLVDAYFGPDLQPPAIGAPPTRAINYIADPDCCGHALGLAATRLLDWNAHCFNAPAAVQRSTRDGVAAALAGIDSIDMPRTLRITPRDPAQISALIRSAGLAGPVLARITGDHGGVSLVRLDVPDDPRPLHAIPWGGRELYLTEFREFADADGQYRKIRLAVVGGQFFVRHLVIGDSWLLHAGRRSDEDEHEEQRFLADFDRITRPRLEAPMREIIARIGLDYFGIDCSLRPDGRLLVFEVNACMNMLHNSQPSPNVWDQPIAAIGDALCALLRDPARWRSGVAAPTGAG